jgi:hypothetical protein
LPATPIFGIRARGEDVQSFREAKLRLKELGYPTEETREFVAQHFHRVAGLVREKIDHRTLLIPVPSGSGENMITFYFAKEINKLSGARVLPDNLVRKLHKGEAKKNLSLEKRNIDPISYEVKAEYIKAIASDYSRVFVLDDLIGSGESSIRLVKTLEKEGIKVDAMINLVTIEKSYPTPGDFSRVHNKIKQYAKLVMTDSVKLSKNLKTVFSDYTRQKLNRFERPIKDEKSAVAAFKTLTKAAAVEMKFNRDKGKNLGL